MKKTNLLLSFILLFTTAFAQYSWVNKNDYSGAARCFATGFSINGKGYVVGGRTTANSSNFQQDTREYNPTTDTWTLKANYPFTFVQGCGFAINGKGYIAGGSDNTSSPVSDTYEFDPVANSWTSKASMPVAMNGGFTFVINNVAYIGCGARTGANNSTTIYAFNPANNSWSSKASYPGLSVVNPSGFSIGNYGYAGLGTTGNGVFSSDFYRYDPSNNSWTPIAAFPGKARCVAMAFSLNGIGYVGGGVRGLGGFYFALSDFYAYDPNTDSWSPVPGLPGVPREGGTVFTIDNAAYEVGGYEDDGAIYYKMVSQFGDCSTISGISAIGGNNHREVNVYPNPTTGELNVKVAGEDISDITYDITNVDGQLVKSGNSRLNSFSFSTNALSNGVYLLTVKDSGGNYTVKRFEVMH